MNRNPRWSPFDVFQPVDAVTDDRSRRGVLQRWISGAHRVVRPLRPPRSKARSSLQLGLLLASSGGFLDAFTYVGHGHVFANAMTGNVVFLGMALVGGDWGRMSSHLLPICAFALGLFVSETFHLPKVHRVVRRPGLTCLAVECLFLLVAGALPANFPDPILILGISFVAALQSSTFGLLESWSYSSVMTTGNLRTCLKAVFSHVVRRENTAGRQALCFGAVCLAFLGGAALGAVVTPLFGNAALWVADLLLGAGMLLFVVELQPVEACG